VNADVWPHGASAVAGCQNRRNLTVSLRLRRGTRVRSVHAKLAGKRVRVVRVRRVGRRARVTVALPARREGTLVVRARLSNGRLVAKKLDYMPCS